MRGSEIFIKQSFAEVALDKNLFTSLNYREILTTINKNNFKCSLFARKKNVKGYKMFKNEKGFSLIELMLKQTSTIDAPLAQSTSVENFAVSYRNRRVWPAS